MAIELGSEFNLQLNSLTVKQNNLFSYWDSNNTIWFDYGRSAIKAIPIKKNKYVLLPEFICESVIACFEKKLVKFYSITPDLEIDENDLFSKVSKSIGVIYINHYFGYIQDISVLKRIKEVAKKYNIVIIEDVTQSMFSLNEYIGDYVVSSVRKWLPVHSGGMMYTDNAHLLRDKYRDCDDDNNRVYGMILKDLFLYESFDANAKYREIFSKCEKKIDESHEIKLLSDFARFLIKCVDVESIKRIRKHNLCKLSDGLAKLGIFSIKAFDDNECPLCFPILIEHRDEFRHYLMNNRIYCAVHWPFDNFSSDERQNAKQISENIISLPLDQRYGDVEIEYMLDVIKKWGDNIA